MFTVELFWMLFIKCCCARCLITCSWFKRIGYKFAKQFHWSKLSHGWDFPGGFRPVPNFLIGVKQKLIDPNWQTAVSVKQKLIDPNWQTAVSVKQKLIGCFQVA